MARHKPNHPTEVELKILTVLWEKGPSTVRQVHEALSEERDTGLSTTLKMMQVMTQKGLLLCDNSIRPQLYQASSSRKKTESKILDDLIQRVFGGSASNLVMRMVSSAQVSEDEMARIKEELKTAERESHD